MADYVQSDHVNKESVLPTHPHHPQYGHVPQSPGAQKHLPSQNYQWCKSSLNNGHHDSCHDDNYPHLNAQLPSEGEDPQESVLKSQYQQLRETCEQHFTDKYIDLSRQADEKSSRIIIQKDKEMEHMQDLIDGLKEKVASASTHVKNLHEVIKGKDTELTNILRKNVELERKQVQYQSEVEVWKAKAERAELLLLNCTKSLQCRCSASLSEQEDTASSFVGDKVVDGVASCKVCGKGTAMITMWSCRHLCICKRCDIPDKCTRVCPVCNYMSVRLEL